jgi:hypothetical protein
MKLLAGMFACAALLGPSVARASASTAELVCNVEASEGDAVYRVRGPLSADQDDPAHYNLEGPLSMSVEVGGEEVASVVLQHQGTVHGQSTWSFGPTWTVSLADPIQQGATVVIYEIQPNDALIDSAGTCEVLLDR